MEKFHPALFLHVVSKVISRGEILPSGDAQTNHGLINLSMVIGVRENDRLLTVHNRMILLSLEFIKIFNLLLSLLVVGV